MKPPPAKKLQWLNRVCRDLAATGFFVAMSRSLGQESAVLLWHDNTLLWHDGAEYHTNWQRQLTPLPTHNVTLEVATPALLDSKAKAVVAMVAAAITHAIDQTLIRRELASETLLRYRESAQVLRAATTLPAILEKPVIAERLLACFPDSIGAGLLTANGSLILGTGIFHGRKGLALPLPAAPEIRTIDKNLANLSTLYYPLDTEEPLWLLLANNQPHQPYTSVDMHHTATLASIAASAFNNARLLRIRTALSRYMPPPVIEQLVRENSDSLDGSEQMATILFADIRSFTKTTEQLGAKGTVAMLNAYYTQAVRVIRNNNGIVDKFLGDGLLAVFGVPFSSPQDADNALQAAIELQETIIENARNFPVPLKVGVGIASGTIISGNVGSPDRMDFTVIGSAVNLAAKLQDMGKQHSWPITLSQSTYLQLSDDMAETCRKANRLYDGEAVYIPKKL